jgi:apolipoprotein D and lipocalin family protein
MNKNSLFATTLLLLSTCLSVQAKQKPVETVPYVDVPSYMGIWYEYAAIPQFFERKCVSDTVAEYALDDAGMVSVKNSCKTKEGSIQVAHGIAKIADPETNSKLKVTFARLFGKWIFVPGGNYWIMALGPHYEYALVGSPTRTYAWILSRTPQLPLETLVQLTDTLKLQGYNPCDLILMPQSGGTSKPGSLCSLLQ